MALQRQGCALPARDTEENVEPQQREQAIPSPPARRATAGMLISVKASVVHSTAMPTQAQMSPGDGSIDPIIGVALTLAVRRWRRESSGAARRLCGVELRVRG